MNEELETRGIDRPSRRNPHLRLACRRCQRRKIRCDCEYPICRNCRKAHAECVDGESTRLQNVAGELRGSSIGEGNRLYQANSAESVALKNRVSSLEALIRARLPDVDLSDLPTAEPGAKQAASNEGQVVGAIPVPTNSGLLSHEIGLVSVASSADPRYIGPSSGYFLARILLAPRQRHALLRPHRQTTTTSTAPPHVVNEFLDTFQGPLPLPNQSHAEMICRIYFDVIHVQYPILHRHLFMEDLRRLYATPENNDPLPAFQLYMVLAIGSTILSRRSKLRVPADSYCLSALQCLDRLNVENSTSGLQCLLLLMIFALHSPQLKMNIWYLNYHCIAAMIDLGLQRNITTGSGLSLFDQEMRTRLFWIVITFDRTLATMMGRPIGVRDEACDLRWPQDIDDRALLPEGCPISEPDQDYLGHMSWSIRLFKLAKINSEIKYVANSVVPSTSTGPGYARPIISDIHEWQTEVLHRLDSWANELPVKDDLNYYILRICHIRHHSMRMLLLRPSPAILQPNFDSLMLCYESASHCISLYEELYRSDLLVYSWITFHDLILSTITMIYCIRTVPDLHRSVDLDALTNSFSASLNILSATGEHWAGAKRSRDVLQDLSRTTVRRIREARQASTMGEQRDSNVTPHEVPATVSDTQTHMTQSTAGMGNYASGMSNPAPSSVMDFAMLEPTWTLPFPDPLGDLENSDLFIQNLFDDLIY